MTRVIALLLTFGVIALEASQPPKRCAETPTLVTELGTREQVPADFTPAPGGGADAYPVPAQPDARYLRVRVSASSVPDCDWYLTARDAAHRPFQVFGPGDFKGVPSRWTHRINGGQAVFDLQPCKDGRKPAITFEEYIWMPERAATPYYSSQQQNPNFVLIAQADTSVRRFGDSVGFLMTSFGRQSWVCSGVMLTPDLLLTNWHCGAPPGTQDAGYWIKDVLRDTLIDLSFDGDGHSRELAVTGLAMKPNKALDFVILRTTPIDARGPVRPVKIGADPDADPSLVIVHHPAGKTKHVSTVDCVVEKKSHEGWQDPALKTEFTHRCDTESGSSGAPVLNKVGELVGLHHLGFEYDEARCEFKDRVNKAVKISAILGAVRDNAKDVFDEIMRWQS